MRLSIRQIFKGFYKLCECGCGQLIPIINTKGKFARFGYRHNFLNKSLNPGKRDKRGENNPRWNGGRKRDRNYWVLFMPDYFSANKNGYVLEHIYVFQEYYQCCMLHWGNVHHIIPVTEDYCNNMIWNLMGIMANKHMSLHSNIRNSIKNSQEIDF